MQKSRPKRGFSLMEVLMLVVILGIVGAAAGKALTAMGKVPGQTDLNYQLETRLISKVEQIRAMPFDSIFAGNPSTSLSDTVTISGVTYPRTVVVAFADGDGNGSPDITFKQVTVTCAGRSISTLISK
jgi:prepilin-type N-terminal cleavage/methylation domain-containing protein